MVKKEEENEAVGMSYCGLGLGGWVGGWVGGWLDVPVESRQTHSPKAAGSGRGWE